MRRKYRITIDEYEAMLAAQDGCCALCSGGPNGQTWHADHDHATGRVRGILCHGRNLGIGHLKDDPALLRRGAEYLER